MNAANVTRLLTYLEQLKASGEEDKWEMSEYLADRKDHGTLLPHEVTNWHCGTAGCLAGSWAIINVKEGGQPPGELQEIAKRFCNDFELFDRDRCHVINGRWSRNGIHATLDEAIVYLRRCLIKGTMDVTIG
jgi:hypothetical protein